MTAATQDIISPRYGAEDQAMPELFNAQVAAATTIYGGTMVMVNSSGYAVPAAAGVAGSLGSVIGRCQRQVANTTAAGYGAAGALKVDVDRGAFWYNLNADSTVTIASFGASVYASDDNTVSLSDGGGTRPYAGYLICIPTTPGIPGLVGGTASTKVAVQVGQPNPWAAIAEQLSLSSIGKARAVVTTLQAYNGSGTNVLTQTTAAAGLSAADGVTLAVNDVVFIQGGTANLAAAKDSGPWQVTTLGSASVSWVLTRPDWFSTGAVCPLGYIVDLGGEGAIWGGTSWKSFAAKGSAVIGTNDPAFYVGRLSQTITLAASTFALCAASAQTTNVGIYSATTTGIDCSSSVGGTPIAGTIGYGPVAAATPGYIGTSVLTIDALASGMAKNGVTDTSKVIVTVTNW
jgi:hypothetical protein